MTSSDWHRTEGKADAIGSREFPAPGRVCSHLAIRDHLGLGSRPLARNAHAMERAAADLGCRLARLRGKQRSVAATRSLAGACASPNRTVSPCNFNFGAYLALQLPFRFEVRALSDRLVSSAPE